MSKWIKPTCEGRVPAPRYDTCLMYDSKGSILPVFSGHSSHCYSDLFTLDVESIVGPPYALIDMLRDGTLLSTLESINPTYKWILAGVALLMQFEE